MATQVQHMPGLTQDHPALPFAGSPNGPRVQQSSSKSSAIRRGKLKISNPIPIDNVVLVNGNGTPQQNGNATATKRYTDPSGLGGATTASESRPSSRWGAPFRSFKHGATHSESDLKIASGRNNRDSRATNTTGPPSPPATSAGYPVASSYHDEAMPMMRKRSPTDPGIRPMTATATLGGSQSYTSAGGRASAGVFRAGSPNTQGWTDSTVLPPPRDRQSGNAEKKGLRGALRKLFRRKSRGPERYSWKPPKETKPERHTYHQNDPVTLDQAPPVIVSVPANLPPDATAPPTPAPPRRAKSQPIHKRKPSAPQEQPQKDPEARSESDPTTSASNQIRNHLPFPMNVNAPSSPPQPDSVNKALDLKRSRSMDEGKQYRKRRASLPSVVFNSAEVAALSAVWNSSLVDGARTSGSQTGNQEDLSRQLQLKQQQESRANNQPLIDSAMDENRDGAGLEFPLPSPEIGVAVTSAGSVRSPNSTTVTKVRRRSRSVGALGEMARRQGWGPGGFRRSQENKDLRDSWASGVAPTPPPKDHPVDSDNDRSGASTAAEQLMAESPQAAPEAYGSEPDEDDVSEVDEVQEVNEVGVALTGNDRRYSEQDDDEYGARMGMPRSRADTLETAKTTQSSPSLGDDSDDPRDGIFQTPTMPDANGDSDPTPVPQAAGMHGFNFGPLSSPSPVPTSTPTPSNLSITDLEPAAGDTNPDAMDGDIVEAPRSAFSPDPSVIEGDGTPSHRRSLITPSPDALGQFEHNTQRESDPRVVEDRMMRLESQFTLLEDAFTKLADQSRRQTMILEGIETPLLPAPLSSHSQTESAWRQLQTREEYEGDTVPNRESRDTDEMPPALQKEAAINPLGSHIISQTKPAATIPKEDPQSVDDESFRSPSARPDSGTLAASPPSSQQRAQRGAPHTQESYSAFYAEDSGTEPESKHTSSHTTSSINPNSEAQNAQEDAALNAAKTATLPPDLTTSKRPMTSNALAAFFSSRRRQRQQRMQLQQQQEQLALQQQQQQQLLQQHQMSVSPGAGSGSSRTATPTAADLASAARSSAADDATAAARRSGNFYNQRSSHDSEHLQDHNAAAAAAVAAVNATGDGSASLGRSPSHNTTIVNPARRNPLHSAPHAHQTGHLASIADTSPDPNATYSPHVNKSATSGSHLRHSADLSGSTTPSSRFSDPDLEVPPPPHVDELLPNNANEKTARPHTIASTTSTLNDDLDKEIPPLPPPRASIPNGGFPTSTPMAMTPNSPAIAIATLAHHVAHERAARKTLERQVRMLADEVKGLRQALYQGGMGLGMDLLPETSSSVGRAVG